MKKERTERERERAISREESSSGVCLEYKCLGLSWDHPFRDTVALGMHEEHTPVTEKRRETRVRFPIRVTKSPTKDPGASDAR